MKKIVFIADGLDNAFMFQRVLTSLDVEVSAGSSQQMQRLLAPPCDLVIFEARGAACDRLPELEALCREKPCSLLVIVEEHDIDAVDYPEGILCDFVVHGASQSECSKRVRHLLHEETGGCSRPSNEFVCIDEMMINLATYQVTVSGDPVDFTYLEYALLAFLAQHPGRTFTRDELLEYVWGFDYSGGTRTVDVHVRRIRAKIGPELAQHLETIRGVGYLWHA